MALYKFANLTVELKNRYKYTELLCKEFLCSDQVEADIIVSVDKDDIEMQKALSPNCDTGYIESVCFLRSLAQELHIYEAMLMHASVIDYCGKGIAFLAASGVGKTTHTQLWKASFGEKVCIINGDKPIIRFEDDVPYAYGTPWAGKEGFYTNDKTPLVAVCFIEQSYTNGINPLNAQEVIGLLAKQIFIPSHPISAIKILELMDRLTKSVNFFKICCNMEKSAAIIALEGMREIL